MNLEILQDSNNEENFIHVEILPRLTHFFVYKSKQLSIDLEMVSRYSNYFYQNLNKFSQIINYEGYEDDPDVSDYIQTFFDICHNKRIPLTDDNVIPLRFLAEKYDAQSIKTIIDRYITKNHDHLLFKIIQFNGKMRLCGIEEEIIAKNFMYYIESKFDGLKTLPVNSIYKIIEIYYKNDYNEEKEEKIIDFIFAYFDVNKERRTSVLFSLVKFSKNRLKYVKKLIDEYSSIFDFNFINEELCKYVFEQNDEYNRLKSLIKDKENSENQINLLQNEKEANIKTIQELNKILEECNEKIKDLKTNNETFNNLINTLQSENENLHLQIDNLNSEINKLKSKSETGENDFDDDSNKETSSSKKRSNRKNSKKYSNRQNKTKAAKFEIENSFSSSDSAISIDKNDDLDTNDDDKEKQIMPSDSLKENNDDLDTNNDSDQINYVEQDSINYKLYSNSKKAFVTYSPYANESSVIPAIINYASEEYKVSKIDDRAFSNSSIKSLSFTKDSNVTQIGAFAFDNSNLENLSLPTSLKKLDKDWCFGAHKLNKVELNGENPYFVIQNNVLINVKNQEICFASREINNEFEIQNKITCIGNSSFSYNCGITSLKSSSLFLKVIGSKSFFNCENLKKIHLNQPFGELTLSNFCFANSQKINLVDISYKDVKFLDYCFFNCSSVPKIEINDTQKVFLGKKVFKKCENLSVFSIKKSSVIIIEEKCFDKLEKLKLIRLISDSIRFKPNFISNCHSLSHIEIQTESDIIINSDIFKGCPLDTVLIHSSDLKLCSCCFNGFRALKNIDICCESFKFEENCFKNSPLLTIFSLIIKQDFTINNEHFIDCDTIQNLTLGSKSKLLISESFLKSFEKINKVYLKGEKVIINESCIEDCNSLTYFEIIGSELIHIGKNQFKNCNSLIKFFINSSDVNGVISLNVKIDEGCFNSCSSFQKLLILKANIVNIKGNQFCNCNSLNNIEIQSNSNINIAKKCFKNTTNLNSVKLSGKSIMIGESCFKGCISLKDLIFENNTELIIMEKAFKNDVNLEGIDFVAKILIIGNECFFGSKLKNFIFNGNTITIGDKCFQQIDTFTSLSITSEGNITIGNSAFESCVSILEATIEAKSELKIQDKCFFGTKNLKKISLKGDKIVIKSYCFSGSSIQILHLYNSENVTLESNAFENCESLTNVTINVNATFNAHPDCFSKATNLLSVQINCSCAIISRCCFAYCTNLTNFILHSENKATLCERAFEECKTLNVIDLSAPLKTIIKSYCFNKTSKLDTVKITSGEISFESHCFNSCSSNLNINCPSADKIKYFKDSFSGLKYKCVTHPNKTTSILNL